MSETGSEYNFTIDDFKVRVTRLTDGLGFGHGTISRVATESQPGNEDVADIVDDVVRSSRILAPVGQHSNGEIVQDDGCPDGRSVIAVSAGDAVLGRSLYRPKVFGGGATMVTAARIGAGLTHGQTLQGVFDASVEQASRHGIEVGGHTDNLARGNNCGCGAIDRAPAIIAAVPQYGLQIGPVVQLVAGETHGFTAVALADRTDLGVIDQFRFVSESVTRQYAGSVVMQKLVDKEAVIKQLADEHLETRIVWNRVPGYTVDQALVREQTNGRAQVFAVDEWRMMDIATALFEEPVDRRRAFISQLAYALGTAAVLTKGDLPVDLIERH